MGLLTFAWEDSMSEIAIYRHLRRLPAECRFRYLPSCRQHIRSPGNL